MRYVFSLLILSLVFSNTYGVSDTAAVILKTPTGTIYGTLKIGYPLRKGGSNPVILIIAGSGPTDRNGNNMFLTNNAYHFLADSLAKHGISSLRYDKRGIGASKKAAPDEKGLRFRDYIDDAEAFIRLLKKDKRFNKIYVLGHSEGSLIGMCAVQHVPANGFISLAGTGLPADSIIMQQLRDSGKMPPGLIDTAGMFFSQMRNGTVPQNVPKTLYAVFRPGIQAYMTSWMKYDPSVEIKKVKIPTLIIQGTTDLQVDTISAHVLAEAKPDAQLVMITGMNHVLREASFDREENFATYGAPGLPLKKELVETIVQFIKTGK